MNGERDFSVEAFRTFLMFGICLLHVCGNTGEPEALYLDRVLRACVPGFVLISGWFGVRFSLRKLMGLYGCAVYATIVAQVVKICFLKESFSFWSACSMFQNFWFLNAYAFLSVLSPTLNRVIDGVRQSQRGSFRIEFMNEEWRPLWLLIGLTFLWGFLHQVSGIARVMPISAGVESYSGVMMIGVYVVGRLLRMKNDEAQIPALVGCGFAVLGASLTVWGHGLECYASPAATLSAGGWFLIIRGNNVAKRMGRAVVCLGPSLFSVYLLHAHKDVGFRLIFELKQRLILAGVPVLPTMFLAAVIVFCSCIVLDAPRRFAACLIFHPRRANHHEA